MGEDNRHEQREREQREQNRQDEKDRQEEQDRQTREICEKLEHEQQNRLVQQHLDKEQQLRNEQETEQRYREIVERNSHELLFQDPYEDEQPFLNLNIDMDSLISKISDQFIKKMDFGATNQPLPQYSIKDHRNPIPAELREPEINPNFLNEIHSRIKDIKMSSEADANELRQFLRICDLIFAQTETVPQEGFLVNEMKFKGKTENVHLF